MENTPLSDATASPSTSAAPAWFTALTAPASAAPEPEQPAPAPDDSSEPAPAPEQAAPEPAQPDGENPEPAATAPDPAPDYKGEIEALQRQVAEMQQAKEQAERQREQEQRQAAILQSREDYWTEVDRIAEGIEDADERNTYYRKAANDLAEQEAKAVKENSELARFQQAIRNFPSYAQQHHGITAEQAAKLTEFAADANPQVAALKIATALDLYMAQNAAAKPPVSPDVTREAVQQTIADRAAAEARESGVTVQGGINGANPAPTQAPPASLQPGSRESHDMLAGILGNLRNR